MGNIRPSFIKIRAIRLCEEYPDRFCPSEQHPVCTCDHIHRCITCGHEMSFNDKRDNCEMVTIKVLKGGKTNEVPCKGKKFTDAYLPHDDPFDHNKALVGQYTDVDNKRMRNWIAGYITRYIQRRKD